MLLIILRDKMCPNNKNINGVFHTFNHFQNRIHINTDTQGSMTVYKNTSNIMNNSLCSIKLWLINSTTNTQTYRNGYQEDQMELI